MLGFVKSILKARLMGAVLRRGVFGGPLGTGLIVAYFGKKAWDNIQRGKRARRLYS